MADKPTIQMKKRTNRFILIGMMAFAGAIIAQLFKLSIVDNSFYQEKANEYHFGEISISANRGSISVSYTHLWRSLHCCIYEQG